MEQTALEFADDKQVQYHLDNPHIYLEFEKKTMQAIGKGFKHWSAEGIFNVIRWETSITAKDDVFKINNNYKSFYARLFEKQNPEYVGFFFKRKSIYDKLV